MAEQPQLVFLGADGGGTKTVFAIIDSSQKLLAQITIEGTNQNNVGKEVARRRILDGITSILAQLPFTNYHVGGLCLGLSGVDNPSDILMIESWVHEILPQAPVSVHSDAVIGLAAGTGGKLHGVVLISGTGSIAMGFNSKGQRHRAGGWGPLLGDIGSGYWLASESLFAFARAADGFGPPTALVEELTKALNLKTPGQLIAWTYTDTDWKRFARLTPITVKCAMAGDEVAKSILERGADGLLDFVGAVLKRLDMEQEEFPLVLVGGMLTHEGSAYAELVKKKVEYRFPSARVIFPSYPLELAAALIALDEYNKRQSATSQQ